MNTGGGDPADPELATLNRRGTRHVCPDCDYEMPAIDRYRDACMRCGQILTNDERAARAVALVFGGRIVKEWDHADRTA